MPLDFETGTRTLIWGSALGVLLHQPAHTGKASGGAVVDQAQLPVRVVLATNRLDRLPKEGARRVGMSVSRSRSPDALEAPLKARSASALRSAFDSGRAFGIAARNIRASPRRPLGVT